MNTPDPHQTANDVQHVEAEPFAGSPLATGTTTVYAVNGGPGCCSGCGCLLIGFAAIALFSLGPLLTILVSVIVAAWLSRIGIAAAGIHRFSPAYVYIFVPIFLTVMALLLRILRGTTPYTFREIVIGTLVVYVFLWLMNAGRNRQPY
ncbi:MAG: hypothetical protein K1X53_12315 [Candidatus Sumerlaeaceae bacterium]|nr:hypothetical protein [Candidatus Sumerlaeaceae bacterium]